MKLSIIMPSLNEEQAIKKTISNIPLAEITRRGFDVEILLIDGKSTDNTKKIAQENGAIVFCCQKGYGKQYRYGFEKATGDIIVTADSDGSYPMEEVPSLIDILIRDNLDFISTNRFTHVRKGSMKTINLFGNKFLTFLTNILFSLNLKDSQSGMWIFKRSILKKISLSSDGMSFSQEIKIEAFKKVSAKEIDSSYYKRIGKTKLLILEDGWKNIQHLFKKKIQEFYKKSASA